MHAETARLVIRDLVQTDRVGLHPILNDPVVTRFTNFHKATEQEMQAWVQECIFHNAQRPRFAHNCAILLKEAGTLIGWIGFGVPRQPGIGDLDFGYALRGDAWNQGYMTEALIETLRFCFAELGAGSVFGECWPQNPASARVMEKAGLRYIGTFASASEPGLIQQRFIAYRDPWLAARWPQWPSSNAGPLSRGGPARWTNAWWPIGGTGTSAPASISARTSTMSRAG